MSAAAAALALAGLVGVPLVLLWSGRHFRRLDARRQRVYRASVIGYGLAGTATLLILLSPPYVWPPSPTPVRLWMAGGLVIGPALGALVGALGGSRDP